MKRMIIKRNQLSLTDIARIGVWLDDPYGDGIRLEAIRNPSEGRLAALAHLRGVPVLDQERLILNEYMLRVLHEDNWTKSGKLAAWIARNL